MRLQGKWVQTVIMLVLLAGVLVSGGLVGAQGDGPSLTLLISGDYWAYDGLNLPLRRLTTWGYNLPPALSSDGVTIAYGSFPQLVVDAFSMGCCGGGGMPTNQWLLNTFTGDGTRIADQPANATLSAEGVPSNVLIRSNPVFSPDGRQVAWTEFDDLANNTQRLMIYDRETNTTRQAVGGLPPQAGVPAPLELWWGERGIYIRSITYNESTQLFEEDVLLFDPVTGAQLGVLDVPELGDSGVVMHVLADFNGQEYMAVYYNNGQWWMIDPATGVADVAPAAPQLYTTAFGEGSYGVQVMPNGSTSTTLRVLDAAGTPVDAFEIPGIVYPYQIAMSYDGRSFAYMMVNEQGVSTAYVWQDGNITPVPVEDLPVPNPFVEALVWAPSGWRIRGDQGGAAQADVACPGALVPRLTIGGEGRVLPGAPNRLRAEPSVNADITGQIPPNGEFVVIQGPACVDAIIWWAVDYGGQSGWTAESASNTYYLEPIP